MSQKQFKTNPPPQHSLVKAVLLSIMYPWDYFRLSQRSEDIPECANNLAMPAPNLEATTTGRKSMLVACNTRRITRESASHRRTWTLRESYKSYASEDQTFSWGVVILSAVGVSSISTKFRPRQHLVVDVPSFDETRRTPYLKETTSSC